MTEDQYNKLSGFSENPKLEEFDATRYRLLNNSCVDFVYFSLKTIGYSRKDFQGDLWPNNNVDDLQKMFTKHGAQIIRDNLTRHGEYYEEKGGMQCLWLTSEDMRTRPLGTNLINIDINSSP
ncbi:hypothetical protein [Photorhabdus sp. CRCIA-P01]|uniref:hypothetical protein n=1 Tax=Photorhabdus sp. CRCIA-P01 TaxID=2019570 RepID=UPI000E599B61|nr:hypothetical protein [Photorhabdus sp. CRCIA-P01]